MEVFVESPTQIERRIKVVVPEATIEKAFDSRLQKLSKTAKVDGFRPGKVPLDVIRQRFSEAARQEALSEVIQQSLYAAMHEQKLSPIGTPVVEPTSVVAGQPLEFVATFEVAPKVESVKFELAKIDKLSSTITEKDIDTVLDRMRKQHTTWAEVDRPAKMDDQVKVDFTGFMKGKAFEGGHAQQYPIILGSKTMVPGFEEGIVGAKQNEERMIHVTFPENYFAKEFAGQPAEFKIVVRKISTPTYPELNEAFAKKLGMKSGTIDELRQEIKKNLEREIKRLTKVRLKETVFIKLVEQNPLLVPKALIEQEAKRIHDQMHPHHKGQEHNHSEEEMATFKDTAKRNVILGFLVAYLSKQHQVTVDKARVQQFITDLSSVYENPEEVMKWYLSNKRSMAEIEIQVLEEQLVEKLLESVQIQEKTVSYNELIGMTNANNLLKETDYAA